MPPVVPEYTMSSIPITGLTELEAHIDAIIADRETPHDAKLIDDVELQLNDTNIPPLLPTLLPKLARALLYTKQDPTALVSLTVKLMSPLSFTQAISLAGEGPLFTAFMSEAPSANILAMTILEKAASSPSDVEKVTEMSSSILTNFFRKWLYAPEVEVGEKGGRVLGALLETDSEVVPLRQVQHAVTVDGIAWSNSSTNNTSGIQRPAGSGKLWQRMTTDMFLVGLLIMGPHRKDLEGQKITPHQASLAQGRLLRLVPRLAALNFAYVARPLVCNVPEDILEETGPMPIFPSLLQFVGCEMVDKSDMLMHLSLIDFFEALISLMRIRVDQGGSDRALIISTLKEVVGKATENDNVLKAALLNLPDRTVPEEAEGLRAFVMEIMG